jgi:hypothetical protein
MSPTKNKGTPGMAALARGKNNESPKTKNNNPSARAATGRVADDASDDNSGDPLYKPRFEDTSDSELDDDDNDAIKQRSSTTMTTKLMEKTKTKTKKNNPSARAATERVADDASDDDSGDPSYKPRFEDTSHSELDDDNNDAIKQQSSTTMTAKLMEKTKTELVNIVLKQRTQIIGLRERLEKEKIIWNQSKKQVMIYKNWTGEETNYADSITQFCKTFLFPS